MPKNLDSALDALESDNGFLKPAFSSELIDSYIEVKRTEAREIAAYPTPIEMLYYRDV